MQLGKSNEQAAHRHHPRHSISDELKSAIQHLIERLRQNQPVNEQNQNEHKKSA